MSDEVREEDEWLYGEGDSSTAKPASGGGAKDLKYLAPVSAEDEDRLLNEDDEGEEASGGGPLSKEEFTRRRNKEASDAEGTDGGPADADSSVQGGPTDETALEQPSNHDQKDADSEDDDDDDDSDDDDGLRVVIGPAIKSTPDQPGQTPFGTAKRPAPAPDKKGKFSVEDFETPGTINGVSALEYNIDGIEDKPWRKPGADITDYFNYGFTEETWKAYSDRQKRMRFEAGGPQIVNPGAKQDSRGVITIPFGQNQQHQHQHQQQRMEIINRRREEPKENTIQVMTADRREYSRKNFEMGMGGPLPPPPFDMSIPPPNFPPPGHGPPGPDFMPNPEYFNHPPPQYYPDEHQGYEEQWMDHHSESWDMGMRGGPPGSSSIVSLTKVTNVPPPPGDEDTSSSLKEERKD